MIIGRRDTPTAADPKEFVCRRRSTFLGVLIQMHLLELILAWDGDFRNWDRAELPSRGREILL